MQRTMVLKRAEAARQLESAVEIFGEDVSARLAEHYATEGGEGVPGPDFEAVLEAVRAKVAAAREALVEADNLRLRRLTRLDELRQERDEGTGRLLKAFLKVRHTLESLYGSREGFQLAGAAGKTPRRAPALLAQVAQTMDLLAGPEVEVPALDLAGVRVDLATLALDLEPPYRELREVLDELERARREVQEAVLATQESIREIDRILVWNTRVLEGFFVQVGARDLAERLRAAPRGGGEEEEEEEPAAEEPVVVDLTAEGPAAADPAVEGPVARGPESGQRGSETAGSEAPVGGAAEAARPPAAARSP